MTDHRSIRRNSLTVGIFLLVGAVTATLYFALLAFLLEVVRTEYRVAVSVSYIIVNIFQFFSNRILTFKAAREPKIDQMVRYLVALALNYLITLAVVTSGVEILRLTPYWSVLIALLITTPVGFILSRNWVFQRATN
jgi:putative flippase GtrA